MSLIQLWLLWQLRCIPTAAHGLDQQHAGFEASLRNCNVVEFVFEQGGLPGNYLEIAIDTIFVPRIEEVKRLLRRCGGVVLLAGFDTEIAQRIQVVLNLLECGEPGLPPVKYIAEITAISDSLLIGMRRAFTLANGGRT